jgi:hypothetical protein
MKHFMLTLLVLFGLLLPTQLAYAQDDSLDTNQAVDSSTSQACLKFDNRQYEVCTAYVFNASLGARLPFYKFGNSTNEARRSLATHRLESRYTGQALARIKNQIAGWPSSVDVAVPRISIKAVSVSSGHNRANLLTRETWEVHSKSGRLLYQENAKSHQVRMSRVPGLVLHKWIVNSIN